MFSKKQIEQIIKICNNYINDNEKTCSEMIRHKNCLARILLNNQNIPLDEEYFKKVKEITKAKTTSDCYNNAVRIGILYNLKPIETAKFLIYDDTKKGGLAFCPVLKAKNALSNFCNFCNSGLNIMEIE